MKRVNFVPDRPSAASCNVVDLYHHKAPLLTLQFLEPHNFPNLLVSNLMCWMCYSVPLAGLHNCLCSEIPQLSPLACEDPLNNTSVI